jgi:hypothetical protein
MFCILSIFHTLVYQVGTAVNSLEYHRPSELPQDEEEHSKAYEHPKDEAEVGGE